jgi:hypothetical protein
MRQTIIQTTEHALNGLAPLAAHHGDRAATIYAAQLQSRAIDRLAAAVRENTEAILAAGGCLPTNGEPPDISAHVSEGGAAS